MGEEHRGKGVDVQLGPVCGPLGRAPEGGRNWVSQSHHQTPTQGLTLQQEGFSPDPYLAGALIAPTIQGIQDAGVMACAKHYIGYEQEHFRQAPEANGYGFNITQSISSNIDDKTMHELYLWYVMRLFDCSRFLMHFKAFRRRCSSWHSFRHVLLQPSQ
jgi:beta-glucosidase